MMYLKHSLKQLVIEPFKWLFYYFFQTDQFKRNVDELKAASQYRDFLFRLGLPIFLISYILVILPIILSPPSNLLVSLIEAAAGTLLGVVIAIVWDLAVDIPVSIVGGLWLGISLGTSMATSWEYGLGILLSTAGGITLGIRDLGKYQKNAIESFLLNLHEFNTKFTEESEVASQIGAKVKHEKLRADYYVGSFVFAFAGGIGNHIEEDNVKRIGAIILSGSLISALVAIISSIIYPNIGGSIFFGILFGIFAGVVGGIALVLFGDTISTITISLGGGIVVGASLTLEMVLWTNGFTFVISIVPAIIAGITWFIGLSIGTKATGKLKVSNPFVFVLKILVGFIIGTAVGIVAGYNAMFIFIISYILSSYRLPLYLASALSLMKVYRTSMRRRIRVYKYLQSSSLHWSEQVPFPLPFLGAILLNLVKQNEKQALQEIQFILDEKRLQINVAWVALFEVVSQKLEKLKTLRDIAELDPFLLEFMQYELYLFPFKWRPRFSSLYDASRDASRYRNSLSWQTRHDALKNMQTNLKKISFKHASTSSSPRSEDKRDERVKTLVNNWLDRAGAKMEELLQEFQPTDQIHNPYVVGPVLAQEASPFAGRRDISQQLEQELRRGSHRPTFFLSGERRMGKSSLLRQLPRLLDDHTFVPIFYNLQAPSVRSSTAAFLGTVAEEIQKVLSAKGKPVEKLERSYLHEMSLSNEAEIYFFFDEWLKKIEPMLENEGLVLLLSFDEFDALLENPEQEGKFWHIDLSWLLSWFRSIIQDRPQLALLFSGGRTIDEIGNETGINWASYFVNVQTFKVSFLKENEARQLITQPIPISDYDYPIEQIFGDGVVDEIVYITGCHPFLVQAVCSELVKYLNAVNRDRAEIKDVKTAVDQVLEKFQATYFVDLWKRTDDNQRACLIAIKSLGIGESNLFKIHQKSGLDERITRRTLQTLLKRDLIMLEDGIYRIASPIFTAWVEQNS